MTEKEVITSLLNKHSGLEAKLSDRLREDLRVDGDDALEILEALEE